MKKILFALLLFSAFLVLLLFPLFASGQTSQGSQFQRTMPKPLEYYSGKFSGGNWMGYATTDEANAAIPSSRRYLGLTVCVGTYPTCVEYWYAGGIADGNLVLKFAGGGGGSSTWGTLSGTLSNQADLQAALNAKQNTLTAGTNITISGSTISASGAGGSSTWGSIAGTLSAQTDLNSVLNSKQSTLSLTTTGTSGASTLTGNILNIPQYTGGSGGASNQLRVFNVVTDFGAIGNGDTTASTRAANKASFEACFAAMVNAGGGKMVVPAGWYVTDPIHVPAFANNSSAGNWLSIEMQGEYVPQFLFGTLPSPGYDLGKGGTIIQCLSRDSTEAAIRFMKPSGASYSFITPKISNLDIRTYQNSRISGIDALNVQQLMVENCQITNGQYSPNSIEPTVKTSIGIICPSTNNGALVTLNNVAVSGFYTGILASEHMASTYMNLTCNKWALFFASSNHNIHIDRLCTQRNQNVFAFDVSPTYVTIGSWDLERWDSSNCSPASMWQAGITDIYDPANHGHLDVTYRLMNIGGSTSLKIVGGRYVLTHIEATERPVYTASNVGIANPVSYDSTNKGMRFATNDGQWGDGYHNVDRYGIGLGVGADGNTDQTYSTGNITGGGHSFFSRYIKTMNLDRFGWLSMYPSGIYNPIKFGTLASSAFFGMLSFNSNFTEPLGSGLFGGYTGGLFMTDPSSLTFRVNGIAKAVISASALTLSVPIVQNVDNDFVNLVRSSTSAYDGFRFQTGVSSNFFIGLEVGDNDLHLFNYTIGHDALSVSLNSGSVILNAPIINKGYTVATLPTGVIGAEAFVTDALSPTYAATVVGGGAVVRKVFYNGSNWIVD